jgi:hypothetical protein
MTLEATGGLFFIEPQKRTFSVSPEEMFDQHRLIGSLKIQ